MLCLLVLAETWQIRLMAHSGMASLALFAWLLTMVDAAAAGRTYAAYGGVYIVASLSWLWLAEGVRPDHWDMTGAAVALAGSAIILAGPR